MLKFSKYILFGCVGLLLCSCVTLHDKGINDENNKKEQNRQTVKYQAEKAEKFAQDIRKIFVFADMLAARVHGYNSKTLSIEESGLYPMEDDFSLAGMRATSNDDDSMAMVTFPDSVNDDIKQAICAIASKEENDARSQKMSYYFVDCPSGG